MEKEEKKIKSIASFEVITRKSGKSGNDYYILQVKTVKGKLADLFLTESQKGLIEEVGVNNCQVDIETRHSNKKNKDYDVIALHIGEELTCDFFPRDRSFIALAKLQAKKLAESKK